MNDELFYRILSFPHSIVVDMNNVMCDTHEMFALKTVDAISSRTGGERFSKNGIQLRLLVGPSTQISRISICNPCETQPNAVDIFRAKFFTLCRICVVRDIPKLPEDSFFCN